MAVQINTALLFTHQVEAYILQIIAQNTSLLFFLSNTVLLLRVHIKTIKLLRKRKGKQMWKRTAISKIKLCCF